MGHRKKRLKPRGGSGGSRGASRGSVAISERRGSMVCLTAGLSVSVDIPVRERGGLGWSLGALARFIGKIARLAWDPESVFWQLWGARAERKRAGVSIRLWDLEIPDYYFWSLWREWGELKLRA